MGSSERRARHKEELRQRILEAAREIIMREGFEALTMRKIAERVEYSPAAIYLHFRDRDEIAKQLSREGFAELFRALEPAAAVEDPVERLRRIAWEYIRFGMENPETYRLIFMEYKYLAVVFGGDSKERDDPTSRAAFDLLVRTAAELSLQVDATPQQIAETLWAAVHGIVSLKLTCPVFPMSTAQELESIMTSALLRGLTGSGQTRTSADSD